MTDRKPVIERRITAIDAQMEAKAATPWATARDRLETHEPDRTYWLATVRPDGGPHLVPILGLFAAGAFYFVAGETTRKGINLAGNPRCAIAVSSIVLPSLDIVIEGDTRKVTGEAALRRVADAYKAKMAWPLEPRGEGVFGPNAPTAGPPPYAVYELTPTTVFGFPGVTGMAEKDGPANAFGPTRWRF